VRRNLQDNNGRSNSQAWGLIVLLLSKAAGHNKLVDGIELDKSVGILHRYFYISIKYHHEMVKIKQLFCVKVKGGWQK
jgi:hypothetical protein